MSEAVYWALFSGYLASWCVYFIHFETEKESAFRFGQRLLAVTLAIHAVFLVVMLVFCPVGKDLLAPLGIPLGVIGMSVYMEWRYRARFLLLFSLPIVLLVSLLLGGHLAPMLSGRPMTSVWFYAHFGFILTGIAGLVASVSSAIMYLWQSAQLKSKKPGQNFLKLPSLATLDRVHFQSLVIGVLLFSLGAAAGVAWARNLQELSSVFRDPKALLALVTCFLYWVIVSVRLSTLRRGQKIAVGTLFVFVLLFLTMVSSYLVPGVFHGRA